MEKYNWMTRTRIKECWVRLLSSACGEGTPRSSPMTCFREGWERPEGAALAPVVPSDSGAPRSETCPAPHQYCYFIWLLKIFI